MDTLHISLLYPDEETRRAHMEGIGVPHIDEEVVSQLGLDTLLPLKNSTLSDYFTTSPEVIRYRQATLADLEKLPTLGETLGRILPILFDIEELRRLDKDSGLHAAESYLYSITEIELYVSCIDILSKGLASLEGQIESPAFQNLAAFVKTLADSAYYKELNEELKKLSSHVNEVHSVTIGVNLDAQHRPTEAGVISLNTDTFKSGKLLDKILRMSFRTDAMTCIAPLTPMGSSKTDTMREALVSAFRGAIEDVFHASVRGWRRIVGDYVLENTDFLLRLLPEIEFVSRATALIGTLKDRGYTLVTPTLKDTREKAFSALSLYNPDVALRIQEPIVPNDLTLDDNGRIYILTGPNRGGKSVITCAMGIAQAMAQLGMKVPADVCALSPVDGIYTHFPEGAEDTIDKGRLGEECARLREIFDHVTGDSMILLDESLSSTGSYEASYIASELLTGFAVCGCRGMFSTHLHELASQVNNINAMSLEKGGVAVDTLVAGIEEGARSFKIYRAKPDGRSYAMDIAKRYGLSLDAIEARLRKDN